jgi:hypothetical protein
MEVTIPTSKALGVLAESQRGVKELTRRALAEHDEEVFNAGHQALLMLACMKRALERDAEIEDWIIAPTGAEEN